MREKPVPVRVGKDIKPLETSMDEFKEEASFEKETGDSVNEDAISKELPSMVSVVPLESPNEFPSKYNTRLYQTATEYRPSSDIPGEFEFLNNESVSESQKQAVKFGVRVFRGKIYEALSCNLLKLTGCLNMDIKLENLNIQSARQMIKLIENTLNIFQLFSGHFVTSFFSNL